MRRGELWTAAGAGYLAKPRPVLIIQDDHFAQTESVTVCPLTSQDADADWWRVEVEASGATGLAAASFVQIDKITTTRRVNLARRIGRVSARQLSDVTARLAAFLGMASAAPVQQDEGVDGGASGADGA